MDTDSWTFTSCSTEVTEGERGLLPSAAHAARGRCHVPPAEQPMHGRTLRTTGRSNINGLYGGNRRKHIQLF